MIQDPDYARIFTKTRCIAWSYGYACMAHGSYTRDLDLLLVPWTVEATSKVEGVVNHIAKTCELEVMEQSRTEKPHGRIAYTLKFQTFGDPRFVDIGFMPVIKQEKL